MTGLKVQNYDNPHLGEKPIPKMDAKTTIEMKETDKNKNSLGALLDPNLKDVDDVEVKAE